MNDYNCLKGVVVHIDYKTETNDFYQSAGIPVISKIFLCLFDSLAPGDVALILKHTHRVLIEYQHTKCIYLWWGCKIISSQFQQNILTSIPVIQR